MRAQFHHKKPRFSLAFGSSLLLPSPMQKEKLQNTLYTAILASEASHVFCCVLPTIFSILSLLAGIGIVVAVPGWLVSVHDVLHHWEVPLIIMSGIVVALGWALHYYSKKIDCHDTGCGHGPCAPKKARANIILKIATILFVVNVAVYVGLHRNADTNIVVIENINSDLNL